MKLNPLRRKPGWESRDPAERARALAQAPLADLGPRLADFVRGDPAPEVRRAALKRLDDLALLADRMRHDDDDGVRDAARARYREMLVDASRPVAERERVVHVEDDQDVLGWVATQAAEPALRRVALERVSRPGTLVERCQRDPDPEIRLWLLSRIDAPATLERIAESARRGDKLLARVARERLEALKLAAGDPATLRARALAICDELDALRRERPADTVVRRDALRTEWQALAPRLDDALQRRVEGYFDALDPKPARAPEPERPAADPATAEAAPDREPAAPVEAPVPPPEDPDVVLARERAAAAAQADRDRRRAERDGLADAIAALEGAVTDGRLSSARPAHAALAALRAATRELPRDLAARLATVEEAYEKLSRWQHWSNNKVRSRLCAEVEAIATSGLHPDAVAAKLKEAQHAWQKLDESEAIEPDAPPSGIAKRFRGACHRALAPTRKYFEKRRELRDTKRGEVDELIAGAERELEQNPRGAQSLRRRVTEALRRLDELDPRVRGEESRKLRAVLTRIDAVQHERAAEAEGAKRKLIANLRRETARAPLDEALEKAKHAQSEWKRLGPAPREVEDALWQELRSVVDPFFEKSSAARTAETQERSAHAAEARAVLDELAALAGDPASLAHADTRVAALTQKWRALPRAPRAETGERDRGARRDDRPGGNRGRDDRPGGARGRDDRRGGRDDRPGARDARGGPRRDAPPARETYDERAFDRAVERVREARLDVARAHERSALDTLREAAASCAAIEDAIADGATPDADAGARIEAMSLPHDARDAIAARLEAALAADADSMREAAAANREYAELLAVRAEFVGGVESPPAARALRKQYQLERLAERMRGGTSAEPRAEARAVFVEWCGFGPVERGVREAAGARIEAALNALL